MKLEEFSGNEERAGRKSEVKLGRVKQGKLEVGELEELREMRRGQVEKVW